MMVARLELPPSTPRARSPLGPLVVGAAGLVAVGLGLYAYLTPLTGVTGSGGALLVVGSSLALVIDAVILWRAPGRALFWVFWALGVAGAIGTLSAGFFLHEWGLMVASLVVLLGLVISLAGRRQGARA